MELFIRFYSLALILVLLGVLARNTLKRNWDLMSWRNLFLLGFIHFYLLGAYLVASGGLSDAQPVTRVVSGSWGPLAAAITLFLPLFLLAAAWGSRRAHLAALLPKVELPVTTPAVLGAAAVLAGSALVFTIPFFSYFGLIAGNLRGQLAGCATGLATYFLIARRFNPVAWFVFLGTLGLCLLIATAGTAGRRMMLGVMLAVPWMFYFATWRYRGATSNLSRVAVFFVIGVLGLIIYTPFRDVGNAVARGFNERTTVSRRAEQLTEILTHPTIEPEAIQGILYTDTVPITLWVLDNYPGVYPYEPLRGAKWFVVNPIPRFLWAEKPNALGWDLARALHTVENFTLGPGVITHGWVEGGFFGVAGYAIFFGVLVGLIDRALADRATNPFFVAAIGANLGNVIALPRGDTPLFLIQIAGGVIASFVLLGVLKIVFGPVWAAFPPLWPSPELSEASGADETGDEPGAHVPEPIPADQPW
jgi:hypothetical protein